MDDWAQGSVNVRMRKGIAGERTWTFGKWLATNLWEGGEYMREQIAES